MVSSQAELSSRISTVHSNASYAVQHCPDYYVVAWDSLVLATYSHHDNSHLCASSSALIRVESDKETVTRGMGYAW